MYVKTTPPGSGLTWKPMGRIFTYVGLRWIPTRKTVETCNNTNDSASPLGKETCISPMIQPELLGSTQGHSIVRIAVLGVSNDVLAETGSIHNLSVFTKMNSDIEDDIMDPVMQCTTLPSHSSFSQQKLVSFVMEIHTLSIDISLRDC
ncbi:hypothetical protein Tco_0694532 [Tanacetum coccineum]